MRVFGRAGIQLSVMAFGYGSVDQRSFREWRELALHIPPFAVRPSRKRSSRLNRLSACCLACSEFTMNVFRATTMPQILYCDMR